MKTHPPPPAGTAATHSLWHAEDAAEVARRWGTDTSAGLTYAEASKRLAEHGPNVLKEKKKKSVFMMFLDQFKDFMIIVLMVSAVVAGVIGDLTDTIAIAVIVVLNAVIGFVQEYRAEKAMAALKKMAAPSSTGLRDGKAATLPAGDLVPGDVVFLEAGNLVPADMRLFNSAHLKVDESALTGESVPVEKLTAPIQDTGAPLGDRKNMAYKGTFATYGRGAGIVVSTGMGTELGRIATMLQEGEEEKTPLQKRLALFSTKLALIVLAICAIVFAVGILRGESPLRMLLTSISLAVAAIPEALPAVVTISLAFGARKMVRQNALIRKLPAMETLGSVTYICSDKTGTLTLNKMTVEEFYVDGSNVPTASLTAQPVPTAALFHQPQALLMTALALNNDVREDSSGRSLGDPTETAPYDAAKNAGFNKTDLEKKFPRVAEIPFDSNRKCMTTLHRVAHGNGGVEYVAFTKGAPDILLSKTQNALGAQGPVAVDAAAIHRANDAMAARGLRVLAVAWRRWAEKPEDLSPQALETDLTFIGLIGMMDPPREEAKEAIRLCRSAGIAPVMITGDHPITARAIARRLGMIGDDHGAIVTGRELAKLSVQDFEDRVEHIRVYARVAPEQKLDIIKALQDKGHFVAMTGDGVNDAPALRRADIGVAMGITGSDVSKEAGHMILLDDNFATIVKSVKEGRRIFDNIRKFIKYAMAGNSGEIWAIFLAPFLGLPIPLLPIHILWINLVTDGLPGLALSAEPAEKGVMNRPPRHPKESIFAQGLGAHTLWVGLLMGFATIFTQAWSLHTGNAHWQTMAFTVLCLSQMGHVLAIRSDSESVFSQGLLSNKPLVGAFLLTLGLQMATIYVPFLHPIFKTETLTAGELAFTLALSSVVFIAVEIEKLVKRVAAKKKASPVAGTPG
ncbi:MAG: cation-translocating P-type ATPase [Elusimicrobia bacterium]|nr:cation-translocating P-type ATPase [Elusimicrobiota bacterium]